MKNVFSLLFLVLFLFNTDFADDKEKKDDLLSSSTFSGLKFRNVGPAFTSGRIGDFAVNPDKPYEYYVAVCSGNVWKTENNGTTWEPIFDKYGSYSIGCITMDPKNHNVLWVGTGENNSQRSVGYGDGVYKSVDGGKNWKNVGLKNSEHVGKIIVDPQNSDIVYVAAQGPLWSDGGDRGLYKTTDGGKTWKLVLEISKHTGVTDIVMDPRDNKILYAASYQRRRHVWTLINGGPESAIYKSVDAGETWDKLSKGLPSGDVGRIGLAISPVDPDILYAIIEAANNKGGFFRSTDRGATWEKRNKMIARSPQYYHEIFADPFDKDRVYSLDTWTMVSNDGGKTFERLGNKHRHVDDHAFWADPEYPGHYYIGGDGGIYETHDWGKTWGFKANLPVTQFYKVSADNTEPFYYIYGGTQDNNSMGGPSRTTSLAGIVNSDWFITNGGDGYEAVADPTDPNTVYTQSQYGWLMRYDKITGEKIGIKPQEAKGEKPFRWNWDTPLIISPHKNTRLYFAANFLFKSEDKGNSWTKISTDLTRQLDRDKLKIMGKVWSVDAVSKNKSTSQYGNIVALDESPLKEGLIYVGTDDGLIQVTENTGQTWTKISKFEDIPETTYVNFILASLHDENVVYAAFNNHKRGDFKPYVLKSINKGKTWESISGDLPERGSVYSLQQDPVNPNLLFAGTEFGVFFTIDEGKNWIQLKSGLPTIAIRDMDIQERENDLVLGTFGRGFYVLDDYTPLRETSKEMLAKDFHLFPVKDTWQYIESRPIGGGSSKSSQGEAYFTADNPPFGATFTYYLKESVKSLRKIRQEKEKELIKNNKPVPFPSDDKLRAEDDQFKSYLLFTVNDEVGNVVRKLKGETKKGIHRINWDLRYSTTDPANPKNETPSGLIAAPGKYTVSVSKVVDGKVTDLQSSQEFTVKLLEEGARTTTGIKELVAFQKELIELNRVIEGSIKTLDELYEKVKHIKVALKNTDNAPLTLLDKTYSIEVKLNALKRKLRTDETLDKRAIGNTPTVEDRLGIIMYELWRTTSAPTQTIRDNYAVAKEEYLEVENTMRSLIDVDIKNLEDELNKISAPWTPGRFIELEK